MEEIEIWKPSSAQGSDPEFNLEGVNHEELYGMCPLGEESDIEDEINLKDIDNEELCYTSCSIPKLQSRYNVSKAKWNHEMRMAEVIEKKGKMWVTTGIIWGGKIYCSIEETLFLVEIGALLLMDENGTCLSLKDVYEKLKKDENGCCVELFEVYRQLKSLGYIVGRHGVPWTMKSTNTVSKSDSLEDQSRNHDVTKTELKYMQSIEAMFTNLQVDELRPSFDVYLPSGKFKKSSPGDPDFRVVLIRADQLSRVKFDIMERQFDGTPLKICHVDLGQVKFFSFERLELPVLP